MTSRSCVAFATASTGSTRSLLATADLDRTFVKLQASSASSVTDFDGINLTYTGLIRSTLTGEHLAAYVGTGPKAARKR